MPMILLLDYRILRDCVFKNLKLGSSGKSMLCFSQSCVDSGVYSNSIYLENGELP